MLINQGQIVNCTYFDIDRKEEKQVDFEPMQSGVMEQQQQAPPPGNPLVFLSRPLLQAE